MILQKIIHVQATVGFSVRSAEIPFTCIPYHTLTCMFFKTPFLHFSFFPVFVVDVVSAVVVLLVLLLLLLTLFFLSILSHYLYPNPIFFESHFSPLQPSKIYVLCSSERPALHACSDRNWSVVTSSAQEQRLHSTRNS